MKKEEKIVGKKKKSWLTSRKKNLLLAGLLSCLILGAVVGAFLAFQPARPPASATWEAADVQITVQSPGRLNFGGYVGVIVGNMSITDHLNETCIPTSMFCDYAQC